MKNKLIDLNNHLFAQLERLGCESMDENTVRVEIQRSKAMSGLAKEVISNARLALDAEKLRKEGLITRPPEMLGNPR